MSANLVHIGFGNYLSADRLVAIAVPKSSPIKRSIQNARDKEMVIDLTDGRRVKSVVFTDSKYIVLTALEPKTIHGRILAGETKE